MIWALLVVQWVLAGFVCVSAAMVSARRRPQFPWVELGLGLVAVTNLATVLPGLVDDSVEPAAWMVTAAMAAWLLVLFTLRERERQVLGLVAQGLSNSAIAERLGLSGKTVANYVSTILSQLRVQDRAAAARLMKERMGPS